MSKIYAGLAITSTNMTVEIRLSGAEVIAHKTIVTPASYAKVVDAAAKLLLIGNKQKPVHSVVGITGSTKNGRIANTGMPGWEGSRLFEDIRRASQLPNVVVAPAAAMSAIGEHSVHRSSSRLAYLDWGAHCTVASTADGKHTQPNSFNQVKIGGYDLKSRFGSEASDLRPQDWDIVVRDMVVGLRKLVDDTGSRVVVIGGSIAADLEDAVLSVAGIQDGFYMWSPSPYHRVKIVEPLCGNPSLRGAVLTAQRLAQ
jgi:predicted NBD/HSP70 family sugar kinase